MVYAAYPSPVTLNELIRDFIEGKSSSSMKELDFILWETLLIILLCRMTSVFGDSGAFGTLEALGEGVDVFLSCRPLKCTITIIQ